jgi:hypothetical protein
MTWSEFKLLVDEGLAIIGETGNSQLDKITIIKGASSERLDVRVSMNESGIEIQEYFKCLR